MAAFSNSPDRLTPGEGLQILRREIPDFDDKCKLFVQKWMYMGEQRRVARMGYVKFGFYQAKHEMFLPWDAPFTDADHVFGLVNSIVLFKDFFGDYVARLYGFQLQWFEYVQEAIFHETSESTIGDWTDDNSNDKGLKDLLEQCAFDEFMVDFPETAQVNHQRQFANVRDGNDAMKLFDKQGFLMGIAYAKLHGFSGSLSMKNNLSEQDKEYSVLVGSERCFDIVYAHMLINYRDHPFLPFFMGINEAIYATIFDKPDKHNKDLAAGQVPEGVKTLYD